MDLKKYIGKRVMVNDEGLYHGRIGILENVVNTEWITHTIVCHVLVNGLPIVLPADKIIVFKENGK